MGRSQQLDESRGQSPPDATSADAEDIGVEQVHPRSSSGAKLESQWHSCSSPFLEQSRDGSEGREFWQFIHRRRLGIWLHSRWRFQLAFEAYRSVDGR